MCNQVRGDSYTCGHMNWKDTDRCHEARQQGKYYVCPGASTYEIKAGGPCEICSEASRQGRPDSQGDQLTSIQQLRLAPLQNQDVGAYTERLPSARSILGQDHDSVLSNTTYGQSGGCNERIGIPVQLTPHQPRLDQSSDPLQYIQAQPTSMQGPNAQSGFESQGRDIEIIFEGPGATRRKEPVRKWTPEEDQKVLDLLDGLHNSRPAWDEIGKAVGRSGTGVEAHYRRNLKGAGNSRRMENRSIEVQDSTSGALLSPSGDDREEAQPPSVMK